MSYNYVETEIDFSSLVQGTATVRDLLTLIATRWSESTGDTFTVTTHTYGSSDVACLEFPNLLAVDTQTRFGVYVKRSSSSSSKLAPDYVLQNETLRLTYYMVGDDGIFRDGYTDINRMMYGDKGTYVEETDHGVVVDSYYSCMGSGEGEDNYNYINPFDSSYNYAVFYIDKRWIQTHGFYSVARGRAKNRDGLPFNVGHCAFITEATRISTGQKTVVMFCIMRYQGKEVRVLSNATSNNNYTDVRLTLQKDEELTFLRLPVYDHKIENFYFVMRSETALGQYLGYRNTGFGWSERAQSPHYFVDHWYYGINVGNKKYYLLANGSSTSFGYGQIIVAIEKKD